MDRIDLLLAIEHASTAFRVYREHVMRNPRSEEVLDIRILDDALRQFSRDAREILAAINPAGVPCGRCNGSGKEP